VTKWSSIAIHGRFAPLRGDDRFINPCFTGVFCSWVGAPGKGGCFPTSDEPVGRYPTPTTTPRTKPLTPKEGVTDETPTVKPHPKGGKGIIASLYLYLTSSIGSNIAIHGVYEGFTISLLPTVLPIPSPIPNEPLPPDKIGNRSLKPSQLT